MKKSNNGFKLPLQKLSWWADFKIQQRLKKAAPAKSFNWQSLLGPQYAMATMCAAIVAVGMFGYTWAPTYFGSSDNQATELLDAELMVSEPMMAQADVAFEALPAVAQNLAGSSMMVNDAMPTMARAKIMADSPFPEMAEVPLALDSYMIAEDGVEAEAVVEDLFNLQEVLVAKLSYGGGFNYGVTFKFFDGREAFIILEGNHQDYDRLVTDIILNAETDLVMKIENEVLEEYLTGELPERE